MKVARASLLALLAPAVSSRFVVESEGNNIELHPDTDKYHIELSPGETRWVTEDEKWELRRVSRSPERERERERTACMHAYRSK